MAWFDPFGNPGTAPAAGVHAGAASVPKLHRACAEFESLFLNQLLEQMRATVARSGFLDGGAAGDMYTAMLDSHMARVMAAGGGIGLASMLQGQLETTEPAPGAGRDGGLITERSQPNPLVRKEGNSNSSP